jgi:trans-2-enoyl-CoA reductase
MEKMKSLADQLREKIVKPGEKSKPDQSAPITQNIQKPVKKKSNPLNASILQALTDYDNSDHKTMVHFRFDKQTVDFLNQFKIATGVDATKFVAFTVRQFIDAHPELKTIIKQFIQNSYL